MKFSAIENQDRFNEIVKEALAKSANYSRWQNAINKAVVQMELHGEFMTWQPETKSLLIWSQESGDIHAANGVCDNCKAFERKFPCWHRAAARLVRLYFEAVEAEKEEIRKQVFEPTYLKPTSTKPVEMCGRIRL